MGRVRGAELIRNQADFVARIAPERMNQDLPIPMELMRRYKEPRDIWPWGEFAFELGCGTAEKTRRVFQELGVAGLALDVSPEAMRTARNNVLAAFCGDVTTKKFMDRMTVDNHMAEFFGMGWMTGLLVNVPGRRHKVLAAADRLLSPGGHLFITEVQRCDEENVALRKLMGDHAYEVFRQGWETRYRNNEAIGLPYGTIVVAKPGPGKLDEWGTPSQLLELMASADEDDGRYERACEHQSVEELRADLTKVVGYEVVELEQGVVPSRVPGLYYPTLTVVASKPGNYRYHTTYRGMSREQVLASGV